MYNRVLHLHLIRSAIFQQKRAFKQFSKPPLCAGNMDIVRPFKSRNQQFVVSVDPPAHLQRLLNEEAGTILYSSYVDSLKGRGRANSLYKRRTRREQSQETKDASMVRPFSVALQYLQENKDIRQNDPHTIDVHSDNEDLVSRNYDLKEANRLSAKDEAKNSWMQDYEAYDDKAADEDDGNIGIYGTPDPSQPVSKIPCFGCGAQLHCAEPSLPGYLPSELFTGQSIDYLKSVTCQRCHFLRHYNTAIDVTVKPAEYVRLISSINDRFALVLLLVDLTDLPGSIWPNMTDIIGSRRPVILVGNKVDLLPRDTPNHLLHVRKCLETAVASTGILRTNIKHTCLISAETGYGVEELITKLHNVWSYRGDVYLLGCTNVGKSSLFNALLRSDYCKSKATDLISKATASPWPGTTMRMLKFPIMRPNDWRMYVRTKRIMSVRGQQQAEAQLRLDQAQVTRRSEHATLIGHIDQTFRAELPRESNDSFGMGRSREPHAPKLDATAKQFASSKWCYDTPGVVQPEQTLNLLTTAELLLAIPKRMLVPRTCRLAVGNTLFVGGMGRLDYIGCRFHYDGADDRRGDLEEETSIRVTVYASERLPLLIVATDQAERIYGRFVGTEMLGVPRVTDTSDDKGRLQRWPALIGRTVRAEGESGGRAACDIVLSSAGWIGINAPELARLRFQVWTPEGRGIAKRMPALIPFGQRLSGPRKRGSLAHQNKLAFV